MEAQSSQPPKDAPPTPRTGHDTQFFSKRKTPPLAKEAFPHGPLSAADPTHTKKGVRSPLTPPNSPGSPSSPLDRRPLATPFPAFPRRKGGREEVGEDLAAGLGKFWGL